MRLVLNLREMYTSVPRFGLYFRGSDYLIVYRHIVYSDNKVLSPTLVLLMEIFKNDKISAFR